MAMTLRLTADQDELLTLLAHEPGTSKREAAARAIVEAGEHYLHQERVTELSRRARERYATVIQRLDE